MKYISFFICKMKNRNLVIFFLPKPTSGLDSFMAQTVVSALIDLAHQNKTVICTIHQPSSQIFEKFDT
jgi:ABC-type multidrug transport system ATPase subunit